jgi:ATP-dependent DNA ligase
VVRFRLRPIAGAPIHYSEHLSGDGQRMFEHASKLNWEGIISKLDSAPYKSERGEAWLKVKTVWRGKFPVVGFIKDPSGVAALYLESCRDRHFSPMFDRVSGQQPRQMPRRLL